MDWEKQFSELMMRGLPKPIEPAKPKTEPSKVEASTAELSEKVFNEIQQEDAAAELQETREARKAETSKESKVEEPEDYIRLGSAFRSEGSEEAYSILIQISKKLSGFLPFTKETEEKNKKEIVKILSDFFLYSDDFSYEKTKVMTPTSAYPVHTFDTLMHLFCITAESFIKENYDPADSEKFSSFVKEYLTKQGQTVAEDKPLIGQALEKSILPKLLEDFKTMVSSQKILKKLGITDTNLGPDHLEDKKAQKTKELVDKQLKKFGEGKEKHTKNVKNIADMVEQAVSKYFSSVQEAPSVILNLKDIKLEVLAVWKKTGDVQFYELDKELNKGEKPTGSTAIIYKIRELFSQKILALKNAFEQTWPGIKQEAETLKFIHEKGEIPNIQTAAENVTVVRGSTIGKIFAYIGKWYEKSDLYNYEKEMTVEQKKDAIKQILNGAAYLEKIGIAHTDLKLENIFVEEGSDGKIIYKISDFGHIETPEKAIEMFKIKQEDLKEQIKKAQTSGEDERTRLLREELDNYKLLYPVSTVFVLPSDVKELREAILADDFKKYQEIRFKCVSFSLGVTFCQLLTGYLPYYEKLRSLSVRQQWSIPDIGDKGVNFDWVRKNLGEAKVPKEFIEVIVRMLRPLRRRISATEALREIIAAETEEVERAAKKPKI